MKMILMMTVRMMNWYVVMARVVYGTKHTVGVTMKFKILSGKLTPFCLKSKREQLQ